MQIPKYYPGGTLTGTLNAAAQRINGAKLGGSLPFVTVGPYDKCDYITNSADDAAQVIEAFDDGALSVRMVGTLKVDPANPIEFTDPGQTLEGGGWGYNGRIERDGATVGPLILVDQIASTLRDFTIDGKKTSNEDGSHGISWVDANEIVIDHLLITGCGGHGIKVDATTPASSGGSSVARCLIKSCYDGIHITANTGDVRTLNNELGENRNFQIANYGGGDLFLGNHIWATSAIHAWLVDSNAAISGGEVSFWIGNEFDGCYVAGLVIGSTELGSLVSGNFFGLPHQSGTKYIICQGARVAMNGNSFRDAVAYVTYAIELGANSNDCVVVGNNLDGDAINDAGTSNVTEHNH